MQRFAQGLPISGQRIPSYDENDDSPDVRTMDLSEIQDEINRLHASVESAQRDQKAAAAEKKKAADDEIKAALEAYRKPAEKLAAEKDPADLPV